MLKLIDRLANWQAEFGLGEATSDEDESPASAKRLTALKSAPLTTTPPPPPTTTSAAATKSQRSWMLCPIDVRVDEPVEAAAAADESVASPLAHESHMSLRSSSCRSLVNGNHRHHRHHNYAHQHSHHHQQQQQRNSSAKSCHNHMRSADDADTTTTTSKNNPHLLDIDCIVTASKAKVKFQRKISPHRQQQQQRQQHQQHQVSRNKYCSALD